MFNVHSIYIVMIWWEVQVIYLFYYEYFFFFDLQIGAQHRVDDTKSFFIKLNQCTHEVDRQLKFFIVFIWKIQNSKLNKLFLAKNKSSNN